MMSAVSRNTWIASWTLALVLAPAPAAQPPAEARWIWGAWSRAGNRPPGEECWFRASFEVGAAPAKARLVASADNHFTVWINGKKAAGGDDWHAAASADVTGHLAAGRNVVAIHARNDGGPAALLAWIEDRGKTGGGPILATSGAFRTSPSGPDGWQDPAFDDRGWLPAKELGPHGTPPWTGITWNAAPPAFEPLPGFRVEEAASGIGSLIALARGRSDREILVSVESGGVLRLADGDGDGSFETTEDFASALRGCQGLLWSRGALFAVARGKEGLGVYRVDDNDPARRPRRLLAFTGDGGEHGPHGIVEGPDGRLFITVGNHAQVAPPLDPDSPYRITYEASLLPGIPDPQGHAVHVKAPGGVVVSIDRDSGPARVVAGGFRNAYDIAFDRHGSLFAWDSDMEWDIGLPWYRPVKLFHVVTGGEYGWRSSSWNWCGDYPDMLPATVDAGRGSPTGIVAYDGKRFPARFRGALLAGDWSQGRILAFLLRPAGATYAGTAEVLLTGRPLNVTDLVVDAAGAVLFTCGGRGTRGGVFRLVYDGPHEDAPRPGPGPTPLDFGVVTPADALHAAMADPGRFVRFAAAREWERRRPPAGPEAIEELPPLARAEALVALARRRLDGKAEGEFPLDALRTAALRLALDGTAPDARPGGLRALQLLALVPGAAPDPATGAALLASFPTGDRALDHETAFLLGRLAPPGTAGRLLDAFDAEPSRAGRIHLAYCLRGVKDGWTPEAWRRIWPWLCDAGRTGGGVCFAGYVAAIRRDLLALMDDATRAWSLGVESAAAAAPAPLALDRDAPRRDPDRTFAVVERILGEPRRSAAEGARVFSKLCAACHLAGGLGRHGGPDLSTAGARYGLADLLTTIIEPSRQIPEQYRALDVFTKDQRLVTGLPVGDDGRTLRLLKADGTEEAIAAADIDERRVAKTSAMPEGLLDGLSLEEIADLCAWLLGGGPPAEPSAPGWRPLFDGGALHGWDGDPALWSVSGRTVSGRAEGLKTSSFLVSKESFSDCRIEFEALVEEGNSGLQFRSRRVDGIEGFVMAGYQADLGEAYWGSLYEERGRGMLLAADRERWEPYLAPRAWNHVLVETRGDRVRIELNGVVTADLRDGGASSGLLGFQLHAGGRTAIRIRHARVATVNP